METWYAGPEQFTIAQGPGSWRLQNRRDLVHAKHDEVDITSAQEPNPQGLADLVGQLIQSREG
jgi:hypothetical protein